MIWHAQSKELDELEFLGIWDVIQLQILAEIRLVKDNIFMKIPAVGNVTKQPCIIRIAIFIGQLAKEKANEMSSFCLTPCWYQCS